MKGIVIAKSEKYNLWLINHSVFKAEIDAPLDPIDELPIGARWICSPAAYVEFADTHFKEYDKIWNISSPIP